MVEYVDHLDIPGKNSAILPDSGFRQDIEQIFTTGRVFYAGQAVGLILATTHELAHKAAKWVVWLYHICC